MSQSVELAPGESTPETVDGYRSLALAVLTLVLIGLCVFLVLPYLPALSWGVALVVIAWPLQTWALRHVPRRGLAAAVTTTIVIVLIVAPGLFVAYHLAREAGSTADRMSEEAAEATVRDKLAGTPGFGPVVGWLDRVGVNIDQEIHKAIENNTRDLTALVQGSLVGLLQF